MQLVIIIIMLATTNSTTTNSSTTTHSLGILPTPTKKNYTNTTSGNVMEYIKIKYMWKQKDSVNVFFFFLTLTQESWLDTYTHKARRKKTLQFRNVERLAQKPLLVSQPKWQPPHSWSFFFFPFPLHKKKLAAPVCAKFHVLYSFSSLLDIEKVHAIQIPEHTVRALRVKWEKGENFNGGDVGRKTDASFLLHTEQTRRTNAAIRRFYDSARTARNLMRITNLAKSEFQVSHRVPPFFPFLPILVLDFF